MLYKMKRPLRCCDIKEGKRYKIIAKPGHWGKNEIYPNMGKIGVAKWVKFYYGVCLLIEDRIERMVKPECLEEVVDGPSPVIQSKMKLSDTNLKVGGRYQIIKVPGFWPKDEMYPDLGKIGRIRRIMPSVCLLTLTKESDQRILPFDCIKEVSSVEIDEKYLIKQIQNNPWGAMRLMKGLSKMNKDVCCRNFVERGIL